VAFFTCAPEAPVLCPRRRPLVTTAAGHGADLDERIGRTSALAHHIVRQVRELDVAQSRLQRVLARVDSVMDVTSTIEAVQTCLSQQQYEEAAQHTFRVLHQPNSPARAGGVLQDDTARIQLGACATGIVCVCMCM
jgi:hypothetical protein